MSVKLEFETWRRRRARMAALTAAIVLAGHAGSVRAQSPATANTPAPVAPAAEAPETLAFQAAARAFHDGIYPRAEADFAEFVRRFPNAPQVPEAILLQARAALRQNKTPTAIALLNAQLARSGALAEEFRFWLAEARLRGGDHAGAAEAFAGFTREYTNSVRLLEAGYGEASARFKLGQLPEVVALLQRPDGPFQRSLKVRANDPFAVRGQLLLADALLAEGKFAAAGQILQGLAGQQLVPEDRWQAQYIQGRIDLAEQRLSAALATTTNLIVSANAAQKPSLLAESVALQGDLLARLNRLDEAEIVLAQNLGETVPAVNRRLALLRIIELELARGETTAAARMLDEFFTKYPEDRATDMALLTQGEVLLKQHLLGLPLTLTNAVTGAVSTNLLAEAQARFDKVIAVHTNSPLLGKAWLNRGWCLWSAGQAAASAAAFTNAVERLPLSEDQAVARFKLGDACYQLGDYTNALRNYGAVAAQYNELPRVCTNLVDQALYQSLRAHLALRDLANADAVALRLARDYPGSALTDRAVLLLAQSHGQTGEAARARALLADFEKRFPKSPLAPEAGMAVARTFVQERKWEAAVTNFEAWLARFPADELRPEAEFHRAWVTAQAGRESNAFALFTNYVATYPNLALTARAQFWVGDHYYRMGDYPNAEMNYQRVVENTNWPVTRLTYEARMMAGRAAFAGQRWINAGGTNNGHFTLLVNDNNCITTAPDIAAEAFFALGDTLLRKEADPARPLAKFNEAREAYSKIPQLFPTNRLVPEAWGMIGNCYLQMAVGNPKLYDNAIEAYQRVVTNEVAGVQVRSQAEIGLAQTIEKLAQTRPVSESTNLLELAFTHYYNIVSEKNLRPGERPDAFWFKEAGVAAASLAEKREQWRVAANLYERLLRELPPLREWLQNRLEKAQEQLRLQRN